jgi:Double-GTPase 1
MAIQTHSNKCILMGLPQSGKSTFLAALWHVVESGEVDNSIKVNFLPIERDYLNKLRELWESCLPLERNKADFIQKIVLNITNNRNQVISDFIVPDVSGEMFELQFESRKLSSGYVEMLRSINGVLLFIDPDRLIKPILISEAFPLICENCGPLTVQNNIKPWTHKGAPTQVVLVDLLQIITTYLDSGIKLGVIISAWDLIIEAPDPEYKKLTPSEWLEKELPLLSQYIKANSNYFEAQTFGVSAQGSKYTENNLKLQSLSKSSKRIIVQIDSKISNDITLPVKWLLNEEF